MSAAPPFTDRQCGILAALAGGKTVAQIAQEQGVRRNVVLRHVDAICHHLRVSSRAEAVQWARAAGLGEQAR